MCVVALVRVSGLRNGDFIDETWEVFWQQIEACVAVMLVSVTAFRSFFVSSDSKKSPKKIAPTNQQVSRKRPFDWTRTAGHRLPKIPSATLTGLRTFIRGDPREDSIYSTLDDSMQLTSQDHSNLENSTDISKVDSTPITFT